MSAYMLSCIEHSCHTKQTERPTNLAPRHQPSLTLAHLFIQLPLVQLCLTVCSEPGSAHPSLLFSAHLLLLHAPRLLQLAAQRMSATPPLSLSAPLLLLLLLSLSPSFTAASSCVVLDYDLTAFSTTDLTYHTPNYTYTYRACNPSPACPDNANLCRTATTTTAGHDQSALPLTHWPVHTADLHPIDTSASVGSDGIGVVLRFTQWTGRQCERVGGGEQRVMMEWVCNPSAKVAVLGVGEPEPGCVWDASIATSLVCQNGGTRKTAGG